MCAHPIPCTFVSFPSFLSSLGFVAICYQLHFDNTQTVPLSFSFVSGHAAMPMLTSFHDGVCHDNLTPVPVQSSPLLSEPHSLQSAELRRREIVLASTVAQASPWLLDNPHC